MLLFQEWVDTSDVSIAICNQCCHILRLMYSFKQMCTKNSEILRGYVSQLTEGGGMAEMKKYKKKIEVKVSLKSVKKYVDHLNSKTTSSDRNKVFDQTIKDKLDSDEMELQSALEPKIEIVEHKIDENVIKIKKNVEETIVKKRGKKNDVLIYGNDLQEKSSTSTLDSLSKLVGETNAEGIEIIKKIVGAPIKQPHWDIMDSESNDFEPPGIELLTVSPEVLLLPETSPDLSATKSNSEMRPRDEIETIYIKQEVDETNTALQNELEPELDNVVQDLLNRTDNFCTVCNKKFQCQSYYERHITIHTGLKTHKCLLCSKMFTRKSTLKTHMNTHTSESYYPCCFCGEIFNYKSVWQNHITIHDRTEYKPREKTKRVYKHSYFPCAVCGKVFSSKGNLKTHLNIHNRSPDAVFNGYRKYSNSLPTKKAPCPICGKMILKTYMSIHISTHSSEFLWLKNQIGK